MHYFLLAINYALMVIIPIAVAVFIRRKTGASWRFFFIGAATFILSQLLHIPFNWLVEQTGLLPSNLESWANLLIVATFLGLSAGIFEETARFLTYRYWAKDARSWSRGLMLGAGHGGSEAIILGVLAAAGFISLLFTLNNETLLNTIPAEQREIIAQSLADIFETPWYGLVLGAAERLFAIITHLALSVMVLQVFLRRSVAWLFAAIGYHALFNMAAVIGVSRLGIYGTELMLGGMAMISLYIIFQLRTPDPVEVEPEPLPEPPSAADLDILPTDDAIDRSRYM